MLKDIIILLFSSLFLSILPTLEPKEFCKAFLENNNSIDYGFQYNPIEKDCALIIGSDFWKLNWDPEYERHIDSVHFKYPQKSLTSGLFSSQYRVVFTANKIEYYYSAKRAGLLYVISKMFCWLCLTFDLN